MPRRGTKRVALYLRVSTLDKQNPKNQQRELEAVAKRHGWKIAAVFSDRASGAKGREKRPGYDALWKAIARRDVDLVAAWSVDRLGRSLQDLIAFLGELRGKGVDLYLHQQGLDTSTPSGRAMFGMLGVFAEFERAMIRERVNAGLARAKAEGKTLGRPRVGDARRDKVIALRKRGASIRAAAKAAGVGVGTAQRILSNVLGRART